MNVGVGEKGREMSIFMDLEDRKRNKFTLDKEYNLSLIKSSNLIKTLIEHKQKCPSN